MSGLACVLSLCMLLSTGKCIQLSTISTTDGKTEFEKGANITFQVTVANVTSGTVLEWKSNNAVISNTSCDLTNDTLSCGSWSSSMATSVVNGTSLTSALSISNFSVPQNYSFYATANSKTSNTMVQLSIVSTVTAAPTNAPPTSPPINASPTNAPPTSNCSSVVNVTKRYDLLYTYETRISTFENCTSTNITLLKYPTSTYNNFSNACGGGCPYAVNTTRSLCFSDTGFCANPDGLRATACRPGYKSLPKCTTPICSQDCSPGKCVSPNWCSLCPFHFESGTTCRNVKLDGFTKGSLTSIAVLIMVIVLLKMGSSWYKKNKVKEN